MFFDKIFKRKEKEVEIIPREDLLVQVKELEQESVKSMRDVQLEYLANFDKEILRAAQKGERRVVSFRCEDGYSEPWQTRTLLDEMKEKYESKGFKVKFVQPYLPDSQDCWLRITWNDEEE